MSAWLRRFWLPAVPALGLALGLALLAAARAEAAGWAFALGTLPVLLALLRDIARGVLAGNAGLDLIAALAMGARGAVASAEAADAVLLVDRLDRLAEALRIARRARGIALQSVAAGIGLSTAGMLAAAAGHLTPVQRAVLQEAIDVAVSLNALRALHG